MQRIYAKQVDVYLYPAIYGGITKDLRSSFGKGSEWYRSGNGESSTNVSKKGPEQ